jgi:hypothetical protein
MIPSCPCEETAYLLKSRSAGFNECVVLTSVINLRGSGGERRSGTFFSLRGFLGTAPHSADA